jgi:hypothetical protein
MSSGRSTRRKPPWSGASSPTTRRASGSRGSPRPSPASAPPLPVPRRRDRMPGWAPSALHAMLGRALYIGIASWGARKKTDVGGRTKVRRWRPETERIRVEVPRIGRRAFDWRRSGQFSHPIPGRPLHQVPVAALISAASRAVQGRLPCSRHLADGQSESRGHLRKPMRPGSRDEAEAYRGVLAPLQRICGFAFSPSCCATSCPAGFHRARCRQGVRRDSPCCQECFGASPRMLVIASGRMFGCLIRRPNE